MRLDDLSPYLIPSLQDCYLECGRCHRSVAPRQALIVWQEYMAPPKRRAHAPRIGVLKMSSEPVRDPTKDWLLTPQNAALVVIDYQPVQVSSIRSMDQELLVKNIVTVAKTAIAYNLPII